MINRNKEPYFKYLDKLRESGVTVMFSVAPRLRNQFRELNPHEARTVVLQWMQTFSQRHSINNTGYSEAI